MLLCLDLELKLNAMSWATSDLYLLQSIGFNDVWIIRGAINICINVAKHKIN